MEQEFPYSGSLPAALMALRVAKWNAIVSKKMKFIREEGDSYVFLHVTKGWRYVSKKRLGVEA
jgi:hypothetical protein